MARVYFATNRVFTGDPQEPFGPTPAPGNPPPIWTGYGEVVMKFPNRGDERYELEGGMHIEGPTTVTPGEPLIHSALANELQSAPSKVRHVILFIHGFANPFRTAFHRVAELRDNYLPAMRAGSANEPLLYLFSWPSDGFVMPARERYMSDRTDAFMSGAALASALRTLIDSLPQTDGAPSPNLKLHLIAHSMGNYALRSGLQKLGQIFSGTLPVLFENVFLMAADEDYDALEAQGGLRPACDLARKVHVYHSTSDLALDISQTTMRNPQRLGWKGPKAFSKVPNNVTLVDCSNVSDTPAIVHAWHQYYRQRQEVFEDVAEVIAGTAPTAIPNRTAVASRRFKLKRRFFIGRPDGGIGNI